MLNYREIRSKLKHGDIKRIADNLGIEQRVASEVLNRGWHPAIKNAVLDEAIKILEEEYNGEADLTERAQEIELGRTSFSVPNKYKRKNKEGVSGSGGGGNIIVYVGIFLLVLFFLVPQFKNFVMGLINKTSGKAE